MANTDHSSMTGTNIHVPHAWTYADTAAREAASGFVPADVGKLALQSDTGDYWRLTDDDPATWVQQTGDAAGVTVDYILIRDSKAQNTQSGTFTAGAWRTRVLTTEVSDTGNHAALASNQITLNAGTYECRISCPAVAVDRHQAKLYNISDSADILIGTSEVASSAHAFSSRSWICGVFTLAAQKILEVQHYCQTSAANQGFGYEGNFTTEVYTVVELWKTG